MNGFLRERCLAYRNRIQQRQTLSLGEKNETGTDGTHSIAAISAGMLPDTLCQSQQIGFGAVSPRGMLRNETNRYSVPSLYAYQALWLKAYVDSIEITNQETVVATHPSDSETGSIYLKSIKQEFKP